VSWIKEVGIRNKVFVTVIGSNIKTKKRERSNNLIFGCDNGGRYNFPSQTMFQWCWSNFELDAWNEVGVLGVWSCL